MHFLGLAGMPRRIPDYAIQFADVNQVVSIGGFAFGLSQLIFLWLAIKCVRGGDLPNESHGTELKALVDGSKPSASSHVCIPKID